jgi:hypothetical protein
MYYQRRILNRYELSEKKQYLVILSSIGIYGVVIFITATIQLQYIDYSTSLQETSCSFYDQHHNLLYSAPYYMGCPNVEIIENTDTNLRLMFTHQTVTYHDELSIDDTKHQDVTGTSKYRIDMEIEYVNSEIYYARVLTESWIAFEGENLSYGYVNAQEDILDYREGYVFQTGHAGMEMIASFYGIMNEDTSGLFLLIEDQGYTTTRFSVIETLTSENFVAFELQKEEVIDDEEVVTPIMEFLRNNDQEESYMLMDYSVVYDLPQTSLDAGLISSAISVSNNGDAIEMKTINEYEGEGYYNTYLFSLDSEYPLLTGHQMRHIDNGEVTYTGETTVTTFNRYGKTFYYTNREFTDSYNFVFEAYHTYEQTAFGYVVIEYDYYDGMFVEFVFNHQEVDPTFYYVAGYGRTLYGSQIGQFNYGDNPFYNRLYSSFFVLPVYCTKTALE